MTNTPELLERLQRHYIKPGQSLPGGVFLPEVGWNNGSGQGGCDAIYVGFTTTSGRILVGHELKVSRADWLNELAKPGKSDAWADQCHEWWLVVSDPAIIQGNELPAGWGLMSPGPSKTRMKVHQAADCKGRDHAPSWLAVRSILARQDTLRASTISQGNQRLREDLRRDIQPQIDAEVERRMRAVPDAERLRAELTAIEDALGFKVDHSGRQWVSRGHIALADLAVIGKAANESHDIRSALQELANGYQVKFVRESLERLERAIANIRALPAGSQLELMT